MASKMALVSWSGMFKTGRFLPVRQRRVMSQPDSLPAPGAPLRFPGRILFLTRDPGRMAAQLAGLDLAEQDVSGTLADDVSTDEITPAAILSHYDDKLGRYPYTGLAAGQARPAGMDAVRNGGFGITVAGKRYGKGSSREHSPAAEQWAGIRLVIAESFERIYRQNADNIGLITSTDFGLVARIRRGEAISLEELTAGRDALAAAILSSGGLLRFGAKHLGGVARVTGAPNTAPAIAPGAVAEATRPRTLFEKIVARHLIATPFTDADPAPGAGAFVAADRRFIHEYYTGMASHMLHAAFGKPLRLSDPASIIVFEDHTSYLAESPAHQRLGLIDNMHAMRAAQRAFAQDYGLASHRTPTEEELRSGEVDAKANAGISHALMAEAYALPGQLVTGTDSHTPHSGALGCVAFGVGTTDMANAFVTGAVRMTMPASLKVELQGTLPLGVTAKDAALHLLALPEIRAGAGVGKVFEFCGSAIEAMSIDERATLTNMTAELGGFTGIVAPDARTVEFLRERRGIEARIELWMHSDAGAAYAAHLRIDCAALSPMLAAPGDPGNGIALDALRAQGRQIAIDIAYGGSCTAGKREDFDHYHAVLAWALEHGLKLPARVSLYLQYGTTAVRDYCEARGYDRAFAAIGARILQPSCGACANCGPGSSTDAAQVTVSAINRNFPGRSGPGQVWLASPPTVMASALAGELISFEELRRRVEHTGSAIQAVT